MEKRIVFMGTPGFAVASLDALHAAGIPIAAVVTAPDRPAGRGRKRRLSDVKERALELGLPVLQPERLRDPGFLAELTRLGADLFVVVAFRMLPEMVWNMPPLGTMNLHASLLPDYRGAAPINWAVINGEQRTGVTTFFIAATIDTGDIIAREECAIGPDETAGELHDRLKEQGADLLVRSVRAVLDGRADRTPQNAMAGTGEVHHAPKLTPENSRIDWELPAVRVHDLVRGLSPAPGAWTTWTRGGSTHTFKVHRSGLVERNEPGTPGELRADGRGLFVRCGDGWLELLEVQLEGRRRMRAADLLNGITITTGERLG